MPRSLPVLSRADAASATTAVQQLLQPSAPAMSGKLLAAAVGLSEGPVGVVVSTQVVKRTAGALLKVLREQAYPEEPQLTCIAEAPAPSDPTDYTAVTSAEAAERVVAALEALQGHPSTVAEAGAAFKPRPTILDYHNSYAAGVVTPSAVAERLIEFLQAYNSDLHWLSAWSAQHIRAAAAAATERYAAGKPLSVMDGVPFVVKDNIDALPYETNFGTKFMGKLHLVKADAPGVAALKELGAVLLGKANMNEFGNLATGYNTHLGNPRNPHNPRKGTGGSSSGSAAAVAAGLCPFALGTDGGGSIRIPASLCGVVGLKTTKGRLADDHGAHGGFSSVTVTGPIATTTADLMLVYAALANVNYPASPSKPTPQAKTNTRKARKGADAAVSAAAAVAAPPLQPLELPKQLLPDLQSSTDSSAQLMQSPSWKPLTGMSFGVCREWYTMCEPGVLAAVDRAAEVLFKFGATLVDVQIPELDLLQVAHSAVFAAEYYYDAGQAGWREDKELRKQLNLDSRMFYANGRMFTSADYNAALRIRARAAVHFERAFSKQCDIIITPATPRAAEDFPLGVHTSGVYDLAKTFESIRFTQPASLLGLPALVLPAGRVDSDGMPVGIQLIGRPYAEALLLKVAAVLEQRIPPVVPAFTVASLLPVAFETPGNATGVSTVKDQLPQPDCTAVVENGSQQNKGGGQQKVTAQKQEGQVVSKLMQMFKQHGGGAAAVKKGAEGSGTAKRVHPVA